MDWILNHLQMLIAIAGAIAYWVNAHKKAASGDRDTGDREEAEQPTPIAPAGRTLWDENQDQLQEENTRRIREEIRRKIAERQAGTVPQPLAMPENNEGYSAGPAAPLVIRPREVVDSPYASEAATSRAQDERDLAAGLARQRALEEQLAALKQRQAEVGRSARAVREGGEALAQVAGAAAAGQVGRETSLLHDLRTAHSLRKAIILREVLGTPVGLR